MIPQFDESSNACSFKNFGITIKPQGKTFGVACAPPHTFQPTENPLKSLLASLILNSAEYLKNGDNDG